MLITTLLFSLFLHGAHHSHSHLSTEAKLGEFVSHPDDSHLYQFRSYCMQSPLHGEKVESHIKDLEALPPTLTIVRALVLVRTHCLEAGGTMEDLDAFLGKDVALKNPDLLIGALAREPESDQIFEALAFVSGKGGDSPFIDCDEKCLPKINDFYDQKAKALSSYKPIDLSQKHTRDQLIDEISKVKVTWKERLKTHAKQN